MRNADSNIVNPNKIGGAAAATQSIFAPGNTVKIDFAASTSSNNVYECSNNLLKSENPLTLGFRFLYITNNQNSYIKERKKVKMMKTLIEKAKTHKEKMLIAFYMFFAVAMTSIYNAEAAGIFDVAGNAINDIKTGIIGISAGLAACCGVIGLVAIMVSGERGAAKWISFLKRVGIAFLCICLITVIISAIQKLANDAM